MTVPDVSKLAPDEKSLAAARQSAVPRLWKDLGLSLEAVWGRCQGSALYQVRLDLNVFGDSCNCPSRKRPCRHVLALLIMLAESPDIIPNTEMPDWVTEWLEKRRVRQAAKAAPAPEAKPVDREAQHKRMARREKRVEGGIEQLQNWLNDLIRDGLASLEGRPPSFWEDQAKRLVDAQAPGLAGRIRSVGNIPGSSPDWPMRLLISLGRLQLLVHASKRLSELDSDLQIEVRQLLGWNLNHQDLEEQGERVSDEWIVIGQRAESSDDRFRTQRTWLLGCHSGETALILDFAPGQQPFETGLETGTVWTGELVFYPGANRQRARLVARTEDPVRFSGRLPGFKTLSEMFDALADRIAKHPWIATEGVVLNDVCPAMQSGGGGWMIRDESGAAVPLKLSEPWMLLAMSGGEPIDLVSEWDGLELRPLSIGAEGGILQL